MQLSSSILLLSILAPAWALEFCLPTDGPQRAGHGVPIRCGKYHIFDSDIDYLLGQIHETCLTAKGGGLWSGAANISTKEHHILWLELQVEITYVAWAGNYYTNIKSVKAPKDGVSR